MRAWKRRRVSTLVVVELIHGVPFEHLVDLHDVGVGSVSLEFVGCAVEAEHEAASSGGRGRHAWDGDGHARSR